MNLLDDVVASPATPSARSRRGYLASALGSVVGALVGGISTGGVAYVLIDCDAVGLECLGAFLIAAAVGVLGGAASAVGACYGALRLRGHERAGRTAAYMCALLPVTVGMAVALAGTLTVFGPVIAIAGAALGARRLAIGKTSSKGGNV